MGEANVVKSVLIIKISDRQRNDKRESLKDVKCESYYPGEVLKTWKREKKYKYLTKEIENIIYEESY